MPGALSTRIFYFILCLGLGLATWMIFHNLGNGSLDLWDESLTAGRSLYVYQHDSILNLKVNGELSIRKPPLMYMLNAASFKVFGVNLFSLRLANALFGFACFVLLAWLTYRVLGLRYAAASPWLLLGSYHIFSISREALTDTIFVTSFLLAAISMTYLFSKDRSPLFPRLLFGLAVLLVLCGKGLVGFFLIGYSLAFLFLFSRDEFTKYLYVSTIFSLPFVLWLAVQWIQNDQMTTVIEQEYIERMSYDSQFLPDHIKGPDWYLRRLWKENRLTGVLGLFGFISVIWVWLSRRTSKPNVISLPVLYIAGLCACYFILISFVVAHKQSRYIMPMIPLLVPIVLFWLKMLWEKPRALPRRTATALLFLCIVSGAYATADHYRRTPDYQPLARKMADTIHDEVVNRKLQPYTDTTPHAMLLHFYLQRQVLVKAAGELPPGSVYVAPPKKAGQPFVVKVVE